MRIWISCRNCWKRYLCRDGAKCPHCGFSLARNLVRLRQWDLLS